MANGKQFIPSMTLLSIYVIIFTCFTVIRDVRGFDLPQFHKSTLENHFSPILYSYEKYCLYSDFKWSLCPSNASSTNKVPPVIKSYNLGDTRRLLDKEIDPKELYNLFLSIPPNVPKSIEGLFRYWNWLIKTTHLDLHKEGIPQPILNYHGTERTSRKEQNPSRSSTDSKVGIINQFITSLDQIERKFYSTTYAALQQLSPPEYVNGISFALSGLFLQMILIALSTEVDQEARMEMDKLTGFDFPEQIKIDVLENLISWLPTSSDRLKFRYKTRLILKRGVSISENFVRGAAAAGNIKIEYLNDTRSTEEITAILNHMVEIDSGGAMHETFEEYELTEGICAVLTTTIYIRPRWRSPPTLLNGTLPFYDDESAPKRRARMIRINDIMGYVNLLELDAEALEIKYATKGLTLVVVAPRGRNLRNLAAHMSTTSVQSFVDRMKKKRIAATLPLFTLRMTLLLPGKMQTMGITRLLEKPCRGLKLSHAVQRIMFWAEAGRYAFKDDGIEWDEAPEQRIIFDRPYLFYVRWHNVTILNGNLVL